MSVPSRSSRGWGMGSRNERLMVLRPTGAAVATCIAAMWKVAVTPVGSDPQLREAEVYGSLDQRVCVV